MEKINAEFSFSFNFAQNLTSLLLVFSKEAILFLIYLLADKSKCVFFVELSFLIDFLHEAALNGVPGKIFICPPSQA